MPGRSSRTVTMLNAVVLSVAAAGAIALWASQSATRSFTVGYVQTLNDVSLLEVVARFTGEKWINTWQGSGDMNTPVLPLDQIPVSWLGKPVPREWTAWSPDGRSRRVHVVGTKRGPACEAPTMLTLAPGEARSAGLAEVVVDSDQRVMGFRELSPSNRDADRAALEAVALEAFRAKAPAAVAEFRGDSLLPAAALTSDALRGQPVTVAFLARPSAPSPAIAYFEAFQAAKGRNGYGIRAAGWLRFAGGRWSAFDVNADVMGSDGAPIPMRRPLGIFQLNGHDYFLIRLSGYEGWATGIYDVDGNAMRELLLTPGGGC